MIIDGFTHQLPDIDPEETAGVARLAWAPSSTSAAGPGPSTS